MNTIELERGERCPDCGELIVYLEVSWHIPVAFKQEMYEACYFDADDCSKPWNGNTVIAFHEDIRS